MSVPLYRQVRPGTVVSIVLKQDQRTGKQVQGTVKDVLTRHDHPRGIKVRLHDGRIGRVQKLVENNTPTSTPLTNPPPVNKRYYRNMVDNNPWHNTPSQSNPFQNDNNNFSAPPGPPPGQQQQQQPSYSGSANPFYGSQLPPEEQNNPWESQATERPSQPAIPPRNPGHSFNVDSQAPPQQGVRRSDTNDLLDSQPDRAEQVEHMQHYESMAAGQESEHDRNRAQLEKEFPSVDGSLIAALYGDSKNISETREMLQELARE